MLALGQGHVLFCNALRTYEGDYEDIPFRGKSWGKLFTYRVWNEIFKFLKAHNFEKATHVSLFLSLYVEIIILTHF